MFSVRFSNLEAVDGFTEIDEAIDYGREAFNGPEFNVVHYNSSNYNYINYNIVYSCYNIIGVGFYIKKY